MAAIAQGHGGWVLVAGGIAIALLFVVLGINDAMNRFDVSRLSGMMRSWAAVSPA